MFKPTKTAISFIPVCVFMLVISCKTTKSITGNSGIVANDSIVYRQALNTAQQFNQLKESHNLTEVNPSNNTIGTQTRDTFKVLVVAWKDSADLKYYNYGKPGYFNTGKFINFVTVVPDLRKWYRHNKVDSAELDLRLKELLGLPPNVNKNCWIEFWVDARDIYRPCKDNRITDNYCDADFPAGTDSAYIKWWNDYHTNSYNNANLYSNYPFSGWGYTYDWSPANRSHIGLSEFCINKNATVYVNGYSSTLAYFRK